ncbi:hypothetical protein HDU67_005043, partial [Dinochytrium kinnereticum]
STKTISECHLDIVESQQASKRPAKKRKRSEKSSTKSGVGDLSEEFSQVIENFRCLNVIHSFIAAQRENSCTFEALQSGVESLRKKKFELEDLGMIVALFSSAMEVYWTPRSSLEDASLQELKMSAGFERKVSKGSGDNVSGKNQMGEDYYTLVVDFKDSKPLKVANPKRPKDEKGKLFGSRYESLVQQTSRSASKTTSLPKTIEGRNSRFREAIDRFISESLLKKCNPWETLRELALDAIPIDPGIRRPTDLLQDAPSTFPKQQDLSSFINYLKTDISFETQRIEDGWRSVPRKSASYADLQSPLSENLARALKEGCGISQLYSHQAHAINEVESGNHVIVATSTS